MVLLQGLPHKALSRRHLVKRKRKKGKSILKSILKSISGVGLKKNYW